MVTILQSERVWPDLVPPPVRLGLHVPSLPGSDPVAIFVYCVSAASNEPRAWSVRSAPTSPSTQRPARGGVVRVPMPARTLLPSDGYWTSRGLDQGNATNRLDDLIVPTPNPVDRRSASSTCTRKAGRPRASGLSTRTATSTACSRDDATSRRTGPPRPPGPPGRTARLQRQRPGRLRQQHHGGPGIRGQGDLVHSAGDGRRDDPDSGVRDGEGPRWNDT